MSRVFWELEAGVPGVKLALKKDEQQLFALLLMLHKEIGMFRIDHKKLQDGIEWATNRQGGIIFVIRWPDENEGQVVASLGMCITSDWYSTDEYLLERWNYVIPQYRRQGDFARRLIETSKWAREKFKADGFEMPLYLGINSFDRTEAKVRLYARHMPCIGAYFMYGEPPVPWQAEKYRRAMREVEEMNRRARGQPAPENRKVVPLVETIIRLGKREVEDVRER